MTKILLWHFMSRFQSLGDCLHEVFQRGWRPRSSRELPPVEDTIQVHMHLKSYSESIYSGRMSVWTSCNISFQERDRLIASCDNLRRLIVYGTLSVFSALNFRFRAFSQKYM